MVRVLAAAAAALLVVAGCGNEDDLTVGCASRSEKRDIREALARSEDLREVSRFDIRDVRIVSGEPAYAAARVDAYEPRSTATAVLRRNGRWTVLAVGSDLFGWADSEDPAVRAVLAGDVECRA